MGFVTNDPKRGDDQEPGATGLVVDLGLMACPQCRREVPDWSPRCPDCGVEAIPRSQLGSAVPDIPAHLLAPSDDDADGDADDGDADDDADDDGDAGDD